MKCPDPCVLAIDNGGTKCEALLVRADGVVLGRGLCRKAGVSGRSKVATRRAAREALRGAPGKLKELRIACHGNILPESFFAPYAERVETRLVTEAQGIFALTGHAHGIIALSGTGAFIHARTTDGREIHLDGLGPLIGDYGGGFFIGRQALRAAACATWHPRRKTLLRDAVLNAYGAKSVEELIPLNWAVRDRSEIAQLAQLVNDAANAGGLGDLIGRQVEGGDGHDGERRGGEHLEVWRLAHEPSGPAVTEEQRDLEEDHAAQPGAGRAAVDGQQAFAHDRLDGEAEERGEGYGGDDQDGQRLRQEVFGAVGVVHF